MPDDKAEAVFNLIIDSAQTVGLLREIKGKQYVDLTGVTHPVDTGDKSDVSDNSTGEEVETKDKGTINPQEITSSLSSQAHT